MYFPVSESRPFTGGSLCQRERFGYRLGGAAPAWDGPVDPLEQARLREAPRRRRETLLGAGANVPRWMAETRRVCPTCGAGYGGDALFCPRDGAPLATRRPETAGDPYLGVRASGDVEIERLVGIGSMGRVYRARQAGLARPVAIKILHREHGRNATLVARFQREGRVAGSLSHPGIVVVHSAGELPRDGQTDGEPYLVMELLDGLSLRSLLAASLGALPLTRALRVATQICDAIGEAHAHGVVHRDLKPENVMLVSVGRDPDFVKVLDFGVARVGDADSSVLTHAGAILGTATYACPETARGERIGPPGDVYSIATMLYECLAGEPPFVGKGPVDVLIQHAQAEAKDVRSHAPAASVPSSIAEVLARSLSKSPAERPSNARELGQALVDAAERGGLGAGALAPRATLLGLSSPGVPSVAQAPTTSLASAVEKKTLRDLGSPRGSA
jgi:eukaryotic-like serine/threonine-protein kinase